MINRVVLVGRLTKDPELKYTASGDAVASFTIAVNRTYKSQSGEREADFINCVIWRKPAENVANFLKKGSLAGVEGRIQTRNYEGQDRKRIYVTEIQCDSVQFLEPKGSSTPSNQNQSGSQSKQQNGQQNENDFPFSGQQKTNEDPFNGDSEPFDPDGLPF